MLLRGAAVPGDFRGRGVEPCAGGAQSDINPLSRTTAFKGRSSHDPQLAFQLVAALAAR
jgi:hypothetical protein